MRNKIKFFFVFIRLNLLAVKISKLPWAKPGHIKGKENTISWLYRFKYKKFSNKLTNIKKKKFDNMNILNSIVLIW